MCLPHSAYLPSGQPWNKQRKGYLFLRWEMMAETKTVLLLTSRPKLPPWTCFVRPHKVMHEHLPKTWALDQLWPVPGIRQVLRKNSLSFVDHWDEARRIIARIIIPTGQLGVPVKGAYIEARGLRESPPWHFSSTLATMSCPLWFKNIQRPDSHDTSVKPSRDWEPQECDVTLAFILSSSCPVALQPSCCPRRLHGHCHPPVLAQDIPEAGMHQGFLFGWC